MGVGDDIWASMWQLQLSDQALQRHRYPIGESSKAETMVGNKPSCYLLEVD